MNQFVPQLTHQGDWLLANLIHIELIRHDYRPAGGPQPPTPARAEKLRAMRAARDALE